jgi:hypothetical protein
MADEIKFPMGMPSWLWSFGRPLPGDVDLSLAEGRVAHVLAGGRPRSPRIPRLPGRLWVSAHLNAARGLPGQGGPDFDPRKRRRT